MTVSVPHFDLPFRYVGGRVVVAQQGSLEEITNCVTAIVSTLVGQREELPDFGIPDPTLERQPIDLASIENAVLEQEPRASLLLTQHPDLLRMLVADVQVQVSIKEVTG